MSPSLFKHGEFQMAILGLLLILAGIGAAVYGFMQKNQAKKLSSAPFVPTGSVNAAAAGPKGEISFEGAVAGPAPLTAPCSGTPCIYYELKVYQKWEKTESTENGTSTSTGRDLHEEKKEGAVFELNDGSGAARVDATAGGIKGDMEKTFSDSKSMAYGSVSWGNYSTSISQLPGDKYSKGIEVEERVIKAGDKLFVSGKFTPSGVTKTDGMMGSLFVSAKGRDAVLGKSAKHGKFGTLGGAAGFVLGALMFAFGGPISSGDGGPSCNDINDATASTCTGKLDKSGYTTNWTVSKAGTFAINASSPKGTKYTTHPDIVVKDKATGAVVAQGSYGSLESHAFTPGSYTVEFSDSLAKHLKGGMSMEYTISHTDENGAVIAAPVANAAGESAGKEVKTLAAIGGAGFASKKGDDFVKALSNSKEFKVTANQETASGPMTTTMVVLVRSKITSPKALNTISVMMMRPTDPSSPLPEATLSATESATKSGGHGAARVQDGAVLTVNTNLGPNESEAVLEDLLN